MKTTFFIFIVVIIGFNQATAQQDSISRSTYFLDQSALPSYKGNVVYNNYYVLINSLAYNVTEKIKISVGALILPASPPFYVNAQYTLPISRKTFIGASIGFYRLEYGRSKSSYLVVPQVLVTVGDQQINTTFNGGIVRGRFLLGVGNLFSPTIINLPNGVNFMLGISHHRPLTQRLSLITQNTYVSSRVRSGNTYSSLFLISIGGAWSFGKNSLKLGAGSLFSINSGDRNFNTLFPFLGYSRFVR